jgi:hypothetical protein
MRGAEQTPVRNAHSFFFGDDQAARIAVPVQFAFADIGSGEDADMDRIGNGKAPDGVVDRRKILKYAAAGTVATVAGMAALATPGERQSKAMEAQAGGAQVKIETRWGKST